MISFEEALNTVFSHANTLGSERIPFLESTGRILAEDIFSDLDMPPFDKSAVDGFACRMDDILSASLRVLETIPAGKIPGFAIKPGHCSKIMTGAMIPEGADGVIMVEDTETAGDQRVRFTRTHTSRNICYRAENIRNGERILEKGILINPAHIAVLASVGAVNPLVSRQPRVGLFSTGDELVEPEVIPGKAQIRNSNASQLMAQLKRVPAIPSYLGIAADEGMSLRAFLDKGFEENDGVLVTGGVSMGDFDFVPAILQEAGVEILFKSIAIQPGRPTVFGIKGNKFVFGLPGNPVSSFVLFEVMVKPFLLRMMGSEHDTPVISL
ncbi:MAG: gephyrin-like molybdotransferase Glp, partial [Bacteroidota bacterium]